MVTYLILKESDSSHVTRDEAQVFRARIWVLFEIFVELSDQGADDYLAIKENTYRG
jgi:hypothetical protein